MCSVTSYVTDNHQYDISLKYIPSFKTYATCVLPCLLSLRSEISPYNEDNAVYSSEIQPTFRRNMSPSLWSKNEPSRKQM
jgi:hypothetical protein